jgi:hypothetical protein
MTFDQALGHSFERLQLMIAEKRRQRAMETLDLAQLIVAGVNGNNDAWSEKQKQLLERINPD